jgi:zinc protease
VRLSLDGGEMLETRDNPLAMTMAPAAGGRAGQLAWTSCRPCWPAMPWATPWRHGDVFDRRGHDATRPLLQLQLMAAYATDPGYRPEAEELFHQGMANYLRGATPRRDRRWARRWAASCRATTRALPCNRRKPTRR